MPGEPDKSFEDWRAFLAQVLALAREMAFPAPVLDVLEERIGDPQPQEWRLDGPKPSYIPGLQAWDASARERVAAVDKDALGAVILGTMDKALRLEQVQSTRLAKELLSLGRSGGGPTRLVIDAGWNCISFAANGVLVSSLRRQPPLDDETALRMFRLMRKALLFWVGDFVAEPDIPYKSLLAWLAKQPYRIGPKLAPLAADITAVLTLAPAADAADRKYVAHMLASMETIRRNLGPAG